MIRPADFRAAVRHGRRIGTPSSVIHIIKRDVMDPARLGFVVSKAVGNAVTRNRVKRRLRAIGSDALKMLPEGTDVVVRALPASSEASWTTLHTEVTEGITMGLARS